MSRKKSLTKKIAHTLMAMSIVYSSGINIVVNEVYAAEKNITNSDASFEEKGEDGKDYSDITNGKDAIVNGKITEKTISSAIKVTATGGKGGDDIFPPTLMKGTKGGDAVARVTVDESLNNIEVGNISVTSYGGRAGSVYQGAAQVAGAAAAYGLEVKHDLTITAADITVNAESKFDYEKSEVEINAAKHSGAAATGLQVNGGKVAFTGNSIIVRAISSVGDDTVKNVEDGVNKLAAGGDAEAYGIRVTGGEVTAKLTNALTVSSVKGSEGGSIGETASAALGHAVAGGDGGNAVAYGVAVDSGIAHLDLQAIGLDTGGSSSTYMTGGAGGDGSLGDASTVGGNGGKGGETNLVGIHIASGKADGKIGEIKIYNAFSSAAGGKGGTGENCISGFGGAGGAIYAAGISNNGGEAELTVDKITIDTKGGDGGALQDVKITDLNSIKAAGKIQAAAGKGGEALAVGVDNRGGNSSITVNEDISVQARGGNGGSGAKVTFGDNITAIDSRVEQILRSEMACGAGGEAIAVGLQNTDGSLTANVKKLSVKATGGRSGTGGNGSIMGAGDSNFGGAAAAYGINVLGGLAESLTASEIEVTATGGSSYYAGEANYGGATGGNSGQGANGAAYGVSNSGGSVGLTVGKITASANGGNSWGGGIGGNGGTGGDGGDGGSAYAYGVWGKGSGSHTVIAVDQIIAEAKAGNGGNGGAASAGQQGQNGQKGEAAEAYGIYAEEGAVIVLSATPDNTDNGTIKIGAKASNTENTEGSKAYAVYADNATVLFGSNAELNTSDGTTANPDIITYLNNATIGFGTPGEGQNVGRTITGSTLQLEGSNTFRVATDLANNKADSFKFDSLAGSSTATQYITVGYDESFDGSKLDSFVGDVTVLTVEDLKGQSLNFVGKESEMDDPLTRFLATPTVEVNAVDDGGVVKITQIDFKEDGASETVLTVADAQMSIANLWRVEGNNLMKRMGELRSDPEAAEGGVWARYYRGEMSADSAYDRSFDQDYTAFQGGIDKMQDYKGGKLYTGIAVNRIDSNASYLAGSGDLSSTGVGVYASWLGSKGHYLDVIARGSKLANDFKLVDKNGREANADYDTWAYGISAEYGYRQNLQGGWFVEPQAELSLGHIGSADYTTSNGVSIKQDAVNSAVTRLGVLSGKEFTMNGRQGNAYVKASLLHDFGGNGGGAAYYNGRSTVVESADMSGTWWEIGLGANLGIAKNSNLYFDALKTFGGDLRTDWQFNAGLRFTF
ncbi:autotransporter outer membrane beta-barrel domain-containing protein [Phascolarctobacterium sp.]